MARLAKRYIFVVYNLGHVADTSAPGRGYDIAYLLQAALTASPRQSVGAQSGCNFGSNIGVTVGHEINLPSGGGGGNIYCISGGAVIR